MQATLSLALQILLQKKSAPVERSFCLLTGQSFSAISSAYRSYRQQSLLSLVTGCFSEVQLQIFAGASVTIFGDRSVLMTGQLLQEPGTGVSLQFRLCTPDIAEKML